MMSKHLQCLKRKLISIDFRKFDCESAYYSLFDNFFYLLTVKIPKDLNNDALPMGLQIIDP